MNEADVQIGRGLLAACVLSVGLVVALAVTSPALLLLVWVLSGMWEITRQLLDLAAPERAQHFTRYTDTNRRN